MQVPGLIPGTICFGARFNAATTGLTTMNMMTKMSGTAGCSSAAELLRSARISRGYSIDDVALTSGLTADEVQAVESGVDADAARISRVAAALGLSADEVLPTAG